MTATSWFGRVSVIVRVMVAMFMFLTLGGVGGAAQSVVAEDAANVDAGSRAVDPQAVGPMSWQGVERCSGETRYETAVQTSLRAFPSEADAVVIATGANWPDALCAAPLCNVENASLLLVARDSIPTAVLTEIRRLSPTSAIILGGTSAVSEQVQYALFDELGEENVRRIAGGDRYETAAMIAAEVMSSPGWSGAAFYATGANFPDALGASAVAASRQMPILLCTSSAIPVATDAVDDGVSSAFIVGGTSVVGSGVEALLRQRVSVTRLFGTSRYETTRAVVEYAVSHWGVNLDCIGVSSGANFPDALAAGVAMGTQNQVQLLTAPTSLSSPTSLFLRGQRGTTDKVVIFGGTTAVSSAVSGQVAALLEPADFEGTGSQATSNFVLQAGLTTFDMTHNGSSNFIVTLYDSNGAWIELLANEIGDYLGSQAVGIEVGGNYILDVDADGPWSIDITQPRPDLASLPYTSSFSGNGPTATDLFRLAPGAKTVTLTHNGSSNFIVLLMDANGGWADLLANEIGSYSGSTVSVVESGAYLLNIDADGDWTVTVH